MSSLSLKKSMTVMSRSSSDKFSRLQKLEKKNIGEEQMVDTNEFTVGRT